VNYGMNHKFRVVGGLPLWCALLRARAHNRSPQSRPDNFLNKIRAAEWVPVDHTRNRNQAENASMLGCSG
jgi:hypothetical protein